MTPRANRALALLVVALVAADWASKFWVVNRVALGHTLEVVGGWLYLAHRQNPGVAFSFFAGMPAGVRLPFLLALNLVALVLFVRMLRRSTDAATRLAIALILAGALGNLGDRLLNGHVTDFVLVPIFPFVFNLADAAISVGGVLLALRLLFTSEPPGDASPSPG
mgnify:FL=1